MVLDECGNCVLLFFIFSCIYGCMSMTIEKANDDWFLCSMDSLVVSEAIGHGMHINEIPGTRSVVGNLEGSIFEVTL